MAVASFALRRAAIRALGRFWSLHVEMREGHEFVTTGPFARPMATSISQWKPKIPAPVFRKKP